MKLLEKWVWFLRDSDQGSRGESLEDGMHWALCRWRAKMKGSLYVRELNMNGLLWTSYCVLVERSINKLDDLEVATRGTKWIEYCSR